MLPLRMLILVGLLCGCTPAVHAEPAVAHGQGATSSPFALVELFTSEGCSSCPPADALLNELAAEGRDTGQPLYPLAFHVDYWDPAGWVDPFSHPVYTLRQRAYQKALRLGNPYTPQMIVNGTEALIGSDRARARHAINAALARPGRAGLTLHTEPRAGHNTVFVYFEMEGGTDDAMVQIALVQSELVSRVLRGENAGKTLYHDNVVRAFHTVVPGELGRGRAEVHLPADWQRAQLAIIGYVQDFKTMAILGAARTEVSLPSIDEESP